MKPQSMTPIEFAIEECQKCLQASPVIVLGSGASVPVGLPGMDALANHLKCSMKAKMGTGPDEELVKKFVSRLVDIGLESALQEVNLNERLSDHIVKETWELICKADLNAFDAVLHNTNHLPLARLYRHLFNSTHRTISVVTTNYDRLAEYAADASGFCHYTGFSYGHLRRRQSPPSRLSLKLGSEQARTVDIWKVHGCLDWFTDQNSSVVALTTATTIPSEFHPAIVTPGIEKYQLAHTEPFRSIIAGADAALARATAYLCIGFGFNDMHIQPKLLERWRSGQALLVVLAKKLSKSIKDILRDANELHYLALEEANSGTLLWSNGHPNGQLLSDVHLWRLPDFLDRST